MIRYPAGNAACNKPALASSECFLLQFPDGGTHEFHRFTADLEDIRLTRMRDSFGNFVDVGYPADGTSWEIADQHGRTQRVHFAGPAGDYDRVSRVELTAFGATTATYTFSYDRTSIRRQGISMVQCGAVANSLFVQLLSRIELPDGSYYDMRYNTTDAVPEYLSGGINSLRVPTGGEMRWKYTPISFPSQDPEGGGDIQNPPQRPLSTVAYGVERKEIALAVGAAALGSWTYDYGKSAHRAPGDNFIKCHSVTTVTDPLGNATRSYFSTSKDSHAWSYALPLTRCHPDVGYDAGGPFLSQEVFSGSPENGTLLRSTYIEYSSDGLQSGNGLDNQDKNHHVVLRRTLYHDDPDATGAPRFKETRFEVFDGLGNFRRKIENGNFSTQDARTTDVDFNASAGEWIINPENGNTTGSTFVMPGRNVPWVLGTFTTQSVTAAGETATVESCFDDRGFLESRRALTSGSRSNVDLLTVAAEFGTSGQVASAKLYGGDNNPITFDNVYGSLCQMTLPSANPQYRNDHSYSRGVRAITASVDPCDGDEILRKLDAVIDQNTGLVSLSRDVSGIATSFVYDTRGRLINEKPAAEAWTSFSYDVPTISLPATTPQVSVRECTNGAATCNPDNALSWSRLQFDGLRRTTQESIRIPTTVGIGIQDRSFTYNALGFKLTETMWESSGRTVFSNYDPFGRPGKVTAPDGKLVNFEYLGDRVKTRDVGIRLPTGATRVYTTELSDAHGRLVGVCEDRRVAWTGGCDEGLLTSYGYDVGSRLTFVCSKDSGTGCGQERHFTHGHRGFRIEERIPELVNQSLHFEFDALGNVISKEFLFAAGAQFDLTYRYDRAGRLIEIREANGPAPARPLKEFFYGYSNNGNDFRKGKIVQARRHNWVDIIEPLRRSNPGQYDAVVTESFHYTGLGGRVGERQTRYRFGETTYAFRTGFSWTQQSSLEGIEYPQCLHSQGDCLSAAPPRTVTYNYAHGFLRDIPGYADRISYQGGGMLHKIEHSNGVDYTMEKDLSGMQRPRRISTTAGWDTGIYQYDGAGNISSIGTQQFRYDGRSQLTSGQVLDGAALRNQTVTYDDYGNITQLVTNGQAVTLPALSTNRLGGAFAHDAAGNLTKFALDGEVAEYTYDALNMMKHLRTNTDLARIFLYTAGDERLATFECVEDVCESRGSSETWTLRDLDGKVLRSWVHPWNEGWQWKEDHVFQQGRPLARVTPSETDFIHLDHLQSPRLITSSAGAVKQLAGFYSFGKEVGQSLDLTLKFTGHEDDGVSESKISLNYMHARFYSNTIGKFLSVDPASTSRLSAPLTWNRFVYAKGNPEKFIDPNGQESRAALALEADLQKVLDGEMSNQEFLERSQARAAPAGFLISLFIPGPEDVALAAFAALRIGSSLAGRAGAFLGRIFRRGGSEGIEAASKSFSRNLEAGDLGIKGDVFELRGTFSVKERVATVRVDMIDAKIKNPLSVVSNLAKKAKDQGATTLKIQGTLANDDLMRVLRRRYKLTTDGELDEIIIDLVAK